MMNTTTTTNTINTLSSTSLSNNSTSNSNGNNDKNSCNRIQTSPSVPTILIPNNNNHSMTSFQQQQLNGLLSNNNNNNNNNNNSNTLTTNRNDAPSSSNNNINNNGSYDDSMNTMIHQWNVLSPQQQEQLLMLFHAQQQQQYQQQLSMMNLATPNQATTPPTASSAFNIGNMMTPMNMMNHPMNTMMNTSNNNMDQHFLSSIMITNPSTRQLSLPMMIPSTSMSTTANSSLQSDDQGSTNVLNHLLLASHNNPLMANPVLNTTMTTPTSSFFASNINPQHNNTTTNVPFNFMFQQQHAQEVNMLQLQQQLLLFGNLTMNASNENNNNNINNNHNQHSTTPVTTTSDFALFNEALSSVGGNMDENPLNFVTDQQMQTNLEELFQHNDQHTHHVSPTLQNDQDANLSLNLSNIHHHHVNTISSSQPSTPRVEGVLLIDQQFDTNTLTDFGLETFSDSNSSSFDNVNVIVEQNLKRKLDVFLEPKSSSGTTNSGSGSTSGGYSSPTAGRTSRSSSNGGLKQTSPLASTTPSVPVSSGFSILDKLPPHQQREYFKRVKMLLTEDEDSNTNLMDQIFSDSASGGSGGSDERFNNFLDFDEDPTASLFSKVKQSPLTDDSSETNVLGAEFEINPMIYSSPLEDNKSPGYYDESTNEYSSQQPKKSRSSSPVDTHRRVINSQQQPTVIVMSGSQKSDSSLSPTLSIPMGSNHYIWNNTTMSVPVSVMSHTSSSSTPFIASQEVPKRKSSGAVKSPSSSTSPLMQTSQSSSSPNTTTTNNGHSNSSSTSSSSSRISQTTTSKSRPSHRKFPTNYFLNMVRAPPNSPIGSKSNSRASSLASSANNSRTNSRTNSRSNSPTTSTPPNFYISPNLQTDASDQQQVFVNSDFMLKLQKSLSSLSQVNNNPFSANNTVNNASRILVTPTPEHHFVNIPATTGAIVVPQNHYLTQAKPFMDIGGMMTQQPGGSTATTNRVGLANNKSPNTVHDEQKDGSNNNHSLNMTTTHDSSGGDFSGDLSKQRKHFLPTNATEVLKDWFLEHIQHPYPSGQEKQALSQQTGLSYVQVSNWFTNTRKRSWQVMKKEYEKRNGVEGSSEAAVPGLLEDANNK
ncbi:hypothetical protein FDP41_003806 [Naegleria fowleri]|uniref:Homeobox domain-containing protein n=1 Tax=Naegleria fowleri TaxID=5763 RepID=A0A6A5BGY8_NAEFO|nr:uncharacterized protein FDP41_003806 [Naegleria fowleri]KAF0977153.1 hypothetical protein FDP41_003806 [Naegleria fowleri]